MNPVGGPRPRKFWISEMFEFGGFNPKTIDFVKELKRENAPSPKLKIGYPTAKINAPSKISDGPSEDPKQTVCGGRVLHGCPALTV